MADFLLELDVFANTAKLEAGLKKAEQLTDKAADQLSENIGSAEQSFTDLLSTIGKVGAGLFLGEAAFKIAGASARAFAGDMEGVDQTLASLPIFGPLITSVQEFQKALDYASDGATVFRAKLAKIELQAKATSDAISAITSELAAQEQLFRLSGFTEYEIAEETYDRRLELIELEKKQKLQAIEDEANARAAAVADQHLDYEEEVRLLNKIRELKYASNKAVEQEAAIKSQVVELERRRARDEARAAEEAERQAKIAERQAEIDAAAEEHQKKIMELEERARKKREEDAAAQKKAQEEQLAFVNARLKMEQEIAEARAEAERQAAGATATVATAGGSFTAAASAQVNEAKLLTKISQQSRDFLAMIVQNTARMAGGLSLG
jgi:flotillin